MQHQYPLRKAIAMIELIFAIVVIGISLLSIPNLLNVSLNSTLVTLQQESIAMAASHTNALMTYAWDEQNTDSVALYTGNKLNANGDGRLNNIGVGLSLALLGARNRLFNVAIASPIGNDTNATAVDTNDDIDDFNGLTFNTIDAVLGGTKNNISDGEYVDVNITQSTTVRYGTDTATYDSATGSFSFSTPFALAAPGGTTNIKLITTTLISNSTAAELQNKQITFNAFICNIGGNLPDIQGNY